MVVNPFIINGYEGPEYFCDRESETAQLIQELVNGNNLALVAPRRMGKSGLIRHCFYQPEISAHYYTFYIDIYATRSLEELVFRMSREILQRLKPFGLRVMQGFWDCVRSIQGGISFSPSGEPSFNLQIGDIVQSESTLDEIFRYLSSADRPCIVAIDEFQQVANYANKNVEALLRTYVQQYPQVRFVFAGSQRHLMTQMFTSPSRPFYQSVSLMDLGSIDEQKYIAFAKKHFTEAGKKLDDGVVEAVFETSQGITWYVQKMMNTLFAQTSIGSTCNLEMVPIAHEYILGTLDFGYRELMFRIPEKQSRVLIAIAKEGRITSVTAGSFIRKHHLNSSSTVQSAIKGLLEKDYISQEGGQYFVYDLFLSDWLKREF